MLRIRLSRTGKPRQPSYRIVVAQRTVSVKGRFVEILGHYLPARNPKQLTVNKEKIAYWIGKGAIPTDTVAALLKKEGVSGMEKYMEPRNKQKKTKGEKTESKPVAPQNAPTEPAKS